MSLSLVTFSLNVFVTVLTSGPTVLLARANGSRVGLRRAGFGRERLPGNAVVMS